MTHTMKTSPVSPADLRASVFSVPPLAWTAENDLAADANHKIAARLAAGGVTTFLYGGNANLQNLAPSQFGPLLDLIVELTPCADAWMIPAIGPDFGKALDQARMATAWDFPTLMTMPAASATVSAGVATGTRRLSDAAGVPIVSYIRSENYLLPADLRRLVDDGVVCAVKYAVEGRDPANDSYLAALCDAIGPDLIVSGMGERPSVSHMRHFGVAGFTSGAICLAPRLAMSILRATQRGEFDLAEQARQAFVPFEDLREQLSPVGVLHDALGLVGIADTGPLQPFQANVGAEHHKRILESANALVVAEDNFSQAFGSAGSVEAL